MNYKYFRMVCTKISDGNIMNGVWIKIGNKSAYYFDTLIKGYNKMDKNFSWSIEFK